MAQILQEPIKEPDKSIMAMAAVLHDTVEDTKLTLLDIKSIFGSKVAKLVDGLTKKDWGKDKPPRAERLEYERNRLKKSDWKVCTIKACDRIDNLREMERSTNTNWMKQYVSESVALNEVLRGKLSLTKEDELFHQIMEIAARVEIMEHAE